MKKQELLVNFKNQIVSKKMFSSILISNNDQEVLNDFSYDLSRMFFCENKSIENDQCRNCTRMSNNNILDYLLVGDGTSAITKIQVNDLIDKFSLTSNEKSEFRVYVIANGENMKVDAANALLKFLEEPPLNTIAVLLTKNRTQILSTIKSRCKLIVIDSEEKQELENKLFEELFLKSKEEILLSNSLLKKMDKSELIKALEETYSKLIIKKYPQIAEFTLDLINDLKFAHVTNISIDNYLIKVSEVI